MRTQMMKLVADDIDVAEIYSPPRVAKRAEQWGLTGGWGLDFETEDSDGKLLNFSKSTTGARTMKNINRDKPLLIVGSPMCIDWSAMMNVNWPRMSAEEKARRMHEALKHLRFCVNIYKHQVSEGRYYVHEHPMSARS